MQPGEVGPAGDVPAEAVVASRLVRLIMATAHEWAGDIVELGQYAELFGWKVGDRVAGSSHAGCGYCRQCQLGHYQLCDNYGSSQVHSQYGHNKPGA